jgi:cell division protein FtsA
MILFKDLLNKNKQGKDTEDTNSIALDIGTEYLKAVLFSNKKDELTVKKLSRIQQQQKAMNKGMIINLSTVLENCNLAIKELVDGLPEDQLPKNIVMGMAGEYIQGASIIVNYDREKEGAEAITEKEQERIVTQIRDQIIQTGKQDLSKRIGVSVNDIEVLHVTITGVEIGGLQVDSLVGFTGHSVKLYFYASFAPKTFVDSLKTLANSLNYSLKAVVAQPFAVARAYIGARNKGFSGIFIDVGGGTTDIAIVINGNVIDTSMFAFGGRVWTKEIALNMNLDYRYAENRKIKYSDKLLDRDLTQKVKKITWGISQLWMESLASALELTEDVDLFPSQIYLCGGGALLPDIKNIMLEYPWTKLLKFNSVPQINLFLPNRLEGVIDQTGVATNSFDITPISLAKFLGDKEFNPSNYFSTI